MAAFGTVKPGFEQAAELQFPQQFSREYARRQLGERYAPSAAAPVVQDYVGNDFFADYHKEKRAEAQRSALSGVGNTRRAINRALVSHAGYYGMPEPVRSQRRIGSDVGTSVGANIYYGAGISNAVGLEGGVIGSREGRTWTKNALVKRVAELDAIDAAQAEGPTIQAAVEKGIEPGQMEETELSTTLQRFLQAARSGDFNSDDLALVPRIVTSLTSFFSIPESLGQLDDYRYEVEGAATILLASLTNESEEDDVVRYEPRTRGEEVRRSLYTISSQKSKALALTFLKKILGYLNTIGNETQGKVPTPKEMKAISRSAAKTVKFGDIKIPDVAEAVSSGPIARRTERILEPYMDVGSASFTRDGTSYEDSSGPASVYSREDLNDFNQDIFGRQGQRGELRGERNYFGEDADQSNWRPGISITEPVPRGFTNITRQQQLATDVDYKEADEGDDEEAAKLARVRAAAEELGLASLSDIELAVDEMPAAQARTFLHQIAQNLRSAYFGKPTTASRQVAENKRHINELLTAAYR